MKLNAIKEKAKLEFDKKFGINIWREDGKFTGWTSYPQEVKEFINKYIDLTAKEMEKQNVKQLKKIYDYGIFEALSLEQLLDKLLEAIEQSQIIKEFNEKQT